MLCAMKIFLSPLVYFLLLFILPDLPTAVDCPEKCTCSDTESTFCFQRRAPFVPKGLDPLVKAIYLFSNGIESITVQDFDNLRSLETLDLSQNKLIHLPDRVFEPLTSLKNLDLSSNQITHISEESFHGMVQLERLYLYSNQIKSIHPAAFTGLENLLELKLQGNQLTSLPPLSMPQLLLLDFRFNVLPSLSPLDLQTPNLESLKLGGVGLTSLNEELIINLKNLHELDISENQLESFPVALKDTPGLFCLNLAGNPMGPLKVEDLQNLKELHELDISNLSLQGLPEELPQLLPQLRKLKVAGNPFNCLCNLAWFPKWLRAQSITLVKTEETRCHFPLVNAGKVLERLAHRDFGCPTTTTVTTSTAKTTTTTTLAVPVTTLSTSTQAPKPSDNSREDDFPMDLVPVSPTNIPDSEQHICPPHTCLNGGTCYLEKSGQVLCTCPQGTSGTYCEVQNHPPPLSPGTALPKGTVTAEPPEICSRETGATSILLDLHRYIEMRPNIHGIRLSYRNLSGPDRRPMQLNLPTSFLEYRLRGLIPNSTYAVCVSPFGAPLGSDSACTEAHTDLGKVPPEKHKGAQTNYVLIPATAILLLLLLIAVAVGVVCYLRRKMPKCHLDLGCEPSQLELDGVKAGLDNGSLPHKQPQLVMPEPVVQNGNLEYEVLIQDDNCGSNNNLSSHKPLYF